MEGISEQEGLDNSKGTVNPKQAEYILDKQFDIFEDIQDNFFKVIRILALGITAIVGFVSILQSRGPPVSAFGNNIDRNIETLSPLFSEEIATILVLLVILVSLCIFIAVSIYISTQIFKAIYNILTGIQSSTLEPVESKYVINSERIQNSNSDKLNSWINSNYKKINKKEEKLDDVYESILLSAFMLLVLFYTAVVGYSASFQLFLIYLGMALIFYWPFRWRDSGKLFAEDLQPNERVDKIKVYSTFAISFVLVSAGLIIDVIA